jgi:aminoglycoside phosphotransferase (APT) family kinase protein
MSAAHAIAPDDVVRRHADRRAGARAPLLVLEPLAAYLDAHGLGAGELEVEPLGDGHSNVTYAVKRDGAELVLRRPPRPPLPPSAHDVLREARVLRALQGRARVPEVLAACADESVIGAPFYVMERVDGHVVTATVPAVLDTLAERRRIAEEHIDTLVQLHAVDWRAAGLEDFGRPTGYPERQLRRFEGLWEHNRTREIPAVERVARRLREDLPASPATTIVHGDFRLGNTMMAASAPARLIAVFDWELATLGDPLADLGYLCSTWAEAGDPPRGMLELSPVTREAGFPTRAELIARYEERTGRPAGNIGWYETLALWKSAIFMEGNYRRALRGTTDDPYLHRSGAAVIELASRAEARLASR